MDTGEGRHDLLNSLCLMSLTFVAFFFPLTYSFTRCWYALLSGQVCNGVVNSCDVMSSFIVMLYDQLCCPASSGQDNRESHIIRKKPPQTAGTLYEKESSHLWSSFPAWTAGCPDFRIPRTALRNCCFRQTPDVCRKRYKLDSFQARLRQWFVFWSSQQKTIPNVLILLSVLPGFL